MTSCHAFSSAIGAIPALAITMSSLPSSAMPSFSAVFSADRSRTSACWATIRAPVSSDELDGGRHVVGGGHRVGHAGDLVAEVDRDDVGAL